MLCVMGDELTRAIEMRPMDARAVDAVHVAECLPSVHRALGSTSSTA